MGQSGRVGINRTSHQSVVRTIAYGSAAGIGIAFASLTGLALYLATRITQPRRSRRPPHYTFTPWEFQIPFREHTLQIGDDLLSIWLMPQEEEDAPCVLCLSGFAAHKAELLGIASNLYRDGFAVMLIDFRGAGRSTGDVVTMGHNETEDARAAIDWFFALYPEAPLGILGYSMGASVALTLAATDTRIASVVADSPFATQREILAYHVRRKTKLPPAPILTLAAPVLKRRHGRTYDDFAPVNIINQIAPRPLFLIQSRNDQIVPFSHGERIWKQAHQPKECWFLDNAGHCGAYFSDRDEYCKRVSAFFRRTLGIA